MQLVNLSKLPSVLSFGLHSHRTEKQLPKELLLYQSIFVKRLTSPFFPTNMDLGLAHTSPSFRDL